MTFLFGTAMGPFTRRLMEYIYEEGFCDEETRDIDWIAYGDMLMKGEVPDKEYEHAKGVVESFTRTKTKAELLEAAFERSLLVAPVATIEEVVESEQLAARGYWRDLDHVELGERVRYPGPFARFAETPIAYRLRPPGVGEHNREVYVGELRLSPGRLRELEAAGVV
ncbi:MAG: CoA transferase [Dehalococcoidia bacterium]|nr:CoA transferase [Dehalococcoidia bacterium]